MNVNMKVDLKNVLIKGGVDEAKRAARSRGVELLYLHEVKAFGDVSTVGYAKAAAFALDRWIVETKSPREAGSLMYWSYVDLDGEVAARLREMYGAAEVDWTLVPPEVAAAVFDRRVAWAELESDDGHEVFLRFGGASSTEPLVEDGGWPVSYVWAMGFVNGLDLEYAGTSNGVDRWERSACEVCEDQPAVTTAERVTARVCADCAMNEPDYEEGELR